MSSQGDITVTSGSTDPSRASWRDDFKKPVTLISIALAILGLALSVYFYLDGKQTRELTLRLVAVTKVYDSSSTSRKLSLFDAERKPVTNDVYVASYQIWNSGTLPIEPSDLRRPFTMRLIGAAKMLDWTISYCLADCDVCRFRLDGSDTNSPPSLLDLKWDHLDVQHGCQIQFLYAGSASAALEFAIPFTGNGRVVDANRAGHWRRPILITAGMVALFGVIFLVEGVKHQLKRKNTQATKMLLWDLVGVPLIGASVLLLLGISAPKPPKSPFPPNVPVSFNSQGNP